MQKLTKFHKIFIAITIIFGALYWFVICPNIWFHIQYNLEKKSLLWMSWPLYTFWISAICVFAILIVLTSAFFGWYLKRMDSCNVSTSTSITQIVKPIDVAVQMDNPAFNCCTDECTAAADMGQTNETGSFDHIYLDEGEDYIVMDGNKTTDMVPIETVTTTTTTVKSEVFMYINDEDDGIEGKVEI